jgi:hypothetical protein
MDRIVDLRTKLSYNKQITPQEFFAHMPYMLKRYKFITTNNFKYILYNLSHKNGKNYKKIFYTVENLVPEMDSCDWAFSFQYDRDFKQPRHFRMPNYVRLGAGENLIKKNIKPKKIMKRKKKFCAFIYRNNVPFRNKFCFELSKYKKVDSPGNCCNNMLNITKILRKRGIFNLKKYEEKVEFLKDYKFCISFENASSPGYTGEKIYHAMQAGCIPIYWGNPLVHRDFNPKSFINSGDIKAKNLSQRIEYLIERVKQIDKNHDLYAKMLKEPWYHNNRLSKYVDPQRILKRFDLIFGINQ